MSRPIAAAFVPMHRWGGLIFGWIIFGVFFTGALTVYMPEISYWATPSLNATHIPNQDQSLKRAVGWLEHNAPQARIWRVTFPTKREPSIGIIYRDESTSKVLRLHPQTLDVVQPHGKGGKLFFGYHYTLHVPRDTNPIFFWAVAAASIFFIGAAISGIVIRGSMLKNLLRIKLDGRTSRMALDVHLLTGILPLAFHIMILYSGLLLIYWTYMPAGVDALYAGNAGAHRKEILRDGVQQLTIPAGESAPTLEIAELLKRGESLIGAGNISHFFVRDPGRSTMLIEIWRRRDDRVGQQVERVLIDGQSGTILRHLNQRSSPLTIQSVMTGLHMAEFAGNMLRFVYFACSFAGAALVGTGLLRFISKRTPKSQPPKPWVNIVTRFSIAVTTGLIFALAGYMLTLKFPISTDTATLSFCGFWLVALTHAFLRPSMAALAEQLWAIMLLCIATVLCGIVQAQHSLWASALSGDWMRFGVDLALLLFSALAGYAAVRVYQKGTSAITS